MSLADELAYGLKQLIAEQGGAVTFRHVTTLDGANPAPNPPTYIAPVVDGAPSAGASSINFRVDATQGGVFTGRLITGDKFSIAGDTTVYTVSSEIISPSTSDTLTAVPFTPVLAQDAADGAAATFSWSADTTGIPALITDYTTKLVNGTTIQEDDQQVRFLASAIPGISPKIGDLIILPSGDVKRIIGLSHMENQGVHYGWSLHVRA